MSASATTNDAIQKNDDSDVPPPPQVDLPTILSVFPEGAPSLYMPAEWSPHAACLILYPHNPHTFRLEQAQQEILYLAQQIVERGQEDVYLLCHNEEVAAATVQRLSQYQHARNGTNKHSIYVEVCPSDDTWARDTAPIFVWKQHARIAIAQSPEKKKQHLIGLDFDFNAYGGPTEGCYWPCTKDQQIASFICRSPSMSAALHIDGGSLSIPMILEGGSIHTDGEGTLLTTQECLLHPNRNPHLKQNDIELVLQRSLGVQKVLWLPAGLDADEDTNGHVDNFCTFVEPGHVVLAWTDDKERDDGNYHRCRQAKAYLDSNVDAQGRKMIITKLYVPSPPLRYTEEEALSMAIPGDDSEESHYIMTRHPGEKMASSYVNFFIANEAVMVPQFGGTAKDTDAKALETLAGVFPGRSVVDIPSREILLGGGNIHCQTQQVPLVTSET